MKQEEIKFRIEQLRKDKIIYAVEATATNLACILGLFFTQSYITDSTKSYLSVLIVIIGIGYTVYMGIGNSLRLKRIKKLEKRLFN
jgi:hypothetical protein